MFWEWLKTFGLLWVIQIHGFVSIGVSYDMKLIGLSLLAINMITSMRNKISSLFMESVKNVTPIPKARDLFDFKII